MSFKHKSSPEPALTIDRSKGGGRQRECVHCGDPCSDGIPGKDGTFFCCQGCKFVYEFLTEHQLGAYYQFEKSPGISAASRFREDAFAILDDAELQRQLLEFSDGTIARATFHLPQIHCSACVWLLENLYRLNPAITQSRVDFLRKELTFSFDERQTSLRQIAELLSSIGYAPRLAHRSAKRPRQKNTNRALYLEVGIAGFAFGNIMLLSFPEYLAGSSAVPAQFSKFFGFVCLALALPVLLYSSRNFFRSAWTGLQQKMLNIDVPISLGILALFGRSLFDVLVHAGTGYFDSFAGLVFFLLIGKVFQQKTYQALSFDNDYRSYFPIAVTKKGESGTCPIPVERVLAGDILQIRHRELIPVDCTLESDHARIDFSFVTGESTPVSKKKGELIFAGGRQLGGLIEVRVLKPFARSQFTRLWNTVDEKKSSVSHLHTVTDRVAKHFTWIILAIAAAAALYWLQFDARLAANAFIAVLIIACPCALALSFPFAMGHAMRILGNNGLFMKNTRAVEALAETDHLVFDKTGTLTHRDLPRIDFVASPGSDELTEMERACVRSLVRHSTHPLSARLYQALTSPDDLPVRDFHEIPGKGITGTVNGRRMRIGAAHWLAPAANGAVDAADAAGSMVFLEIDGRVRGHYRIVQNYRHGLKNTLQTLAQKFDMSLLSGDHAHEKPFFRTLLGKANELRFAESPADKWRYVRKLQSRGRRVLMLGDGLNDASAIRQADIGVALAEDISAFAPACDAILEGNSFEKLPRFLQFAQLSLKIVNSSFIMSFLYNAIGLSFAVRGTLSPLIAAVLMPLSSITVIAFTTFATRFSARKIGLR